MRVERSFAFLDICGFTTFMDRHGDERAVLLLAAMRAELREASARHGIRIVKWLGDGAMLSSTDPAALARLVVEVHSQLGRTVPSLKLRAGLDTGPVIMFEGDDYIGRPVNIASRLCNLAQPGQILATATAAAAAQLPEWIKPSTETGVDIDGINDVIAVSELREIRRNPPNTSPDAVRLLDWLRLSTG